MTDADVPELAANGEIVPRIIADDLLDAVAWGNIAGCDYRGGVSHYARSALAARDLNLASLPVFLSSRTPDARIDHLSGQDYAAALDRSPALIAAGRTSMIMPLLWADELIAARLADDMRGT